MKKFFTTLLFAIVIKSIGYTQDPNGESAWRDDILYRLDTTTQDSSRVLLIADLANYYKYYLPDSSLFYGYKALEFARKIKYAKGEVKALGYILMTQNILGNDSKALQIALQGLKIAERNNLPNAKAALLSGLGRTYNGIKDHTKALAFFKKSKALSDSLHDQALSVIARNSLVETYLMLNQPDSALYYCLSLQSADEYARQTGEVWVIYQTLLNLGRIQHQKGNADLALAYLRQSLSMAFSADMIFNSYFSTAQLYQQMNKPDSCIYYANKSLDIIQARGFYSNIIKANILLSGIYEKRYPQKALQYSKTAILYKDSLNHLGKATSFENFIAFDEHERQYEIDTANTAYRSRIKQYVLIAGLVVFLLIVFILYHNNRKKQQTNKVLKQALSNLKATQAQLIQQEKMASLGELTAGIAHEIQNPLNFVNNFSEVNMELIDEMQQELKTGNSDEAITISNNIKENQEKINFHGKRADAIVKGMLQHSRSSSGVKEPTNINVLADEYLRLAYHGLRAKDKSFNAKFETDFDASISMISVMPQDIGRVILNLINNAFYAVTEKRKLGIAGYEPTVTVSTKKSGDMVEIKVADNGNGIPQKVLNKIFQPFFTTKPTGQGTGLGLSLSYDIIKAHGGELKVDTEEGKFTEFVIHLPLNKNM